MPADAEASLTPAIAGMSGKSVGASGETADDMSKFPNITTTNICLGRACPGHPSLFSMEARVEDVDGRDKPGHEVGRYYRVERSDSEFLLLGRRHLALRRLGGLSLGRRGSGLVHALDLRGFAQLRYIVGLRLAGHVGLDLAVDLIELGGLAVALFLDLDDVPAELRLDGVGNLAGLQRERDRREFRHHLLLGEEAEIAAVRSAGILGFLLGEFGEIGALLELVLDRLGLVLGLDQNVPGMDFLLARDLPGGLLVDLLHGIVG